MHALKLKQLAQQQAAANGSSGGSGASDSAGTSAAATSNGGGLVFVAPPVIHIENHVHLDNAVIAAPGGINNLAQQLTRPIVANIKNIGRRTAGGPLNVFQN